MVSEKHEARAAIMLTWLENEDCPLKVDEAKQLKELWLTPANFPSMEKAIYTATREMLKNVEGSPLDAIKNVDAVRAAIGSDLVDMETDLIAFHEKYGEHLRQKGKAGVFAAFDSSTHYAEVAINEIIRRLR